MFLSLTGTGRMLNYQIKEKVKDNLNNEGTIEKSNHKKKHERVELPHQVVLSLLK